MAEELMSKKFQGNVFYSDSTLSIITSHIKNGTNTAGKSLRLTLANPRVANEAKTAVAADRVIGNLKE